MEEDKYLFKYRNTVSVPPLSMVDDLLSISKCGKESVLVNAFLNVKTNIKKLQYGEDKCFKMHVGLDKSICPDLMIDKWTTVETEKVKAGESSIKDVYVGKHLISEKTRERYLGDVIDSKGKMNSNIEKRVKKVMRKLNRLWAILMTFALENITLL